MPCCERRFSQVVCCKSTPSPPAAWPAGLRAHSHHAPSSVIGLLPKTLPARRGVAARRRDSLMGPNALRPSPRQAQRDAPLGGAVAAGAGVERLVPARLPPRLHLRGGLVWAAAHPGLPVRCTPGWVWAPAHPGLCYTSGRAWAPAHPGLSCTPRGWLPPSLLHLSAPVLAPRPLYPTSPPLCWRPALCPPPLRPCAGARPCAAVQVHGAGGHAGAQRPLKPRHSLRRRLRGSCLRHAPAAPPGGQTLGAQRHASAARREETNPGGQRDP